MLKNPIADFFPVEERVDGLYLKVSRQDKEKIRIENLLCTLEAARVLNFDTIKITDVYTRARGSFEKIGPLFVYYNPELERYVEINLTPQRASIKVNSSHIAGGVKISDSQLLYFLKRKGIVHGIKQEELKKIYLESVYDVFVEVASATLPVQGNDAVIDYLIAIDPDSSPNIGEDGRVDYRNIKTFTSVSAKQPIVKKIPATQGKTGMSILGDAIPAEAGKDVPLPRGRNTEDAPDGQMLLASKSGIIAKEGSTLHVMELLNISGDVDFSVGNIKYSGDVMISGNVMPGFVIEAEGAIHIRGEVESARIISRNSCVHVDRGIIGKGDTFISAKTGVSIAFAQETNIATEGHVSVEKYLLHCDCTCGSLETRDGSGSLIGGHIRAEKSVQAANVGSEKGIRTKVTLFDKEIMIIQEKLKELAELEKKLIAEIGPVERQLKSKSAMMKKFGDTTSERQVLEIKKWIDAYNALNIKIKYVHQKMDDLKAAAENVKKKSHDGYVKISGHVYPGVEFDLYERLFPVVNVMSNKKFRIEKLEISYDL